MDVSAEKSIDIDGEPVSERRGGRRNKVLKSAVASFNKDYSVFDCIVRNESEGGALLTMSETYALPDEFKVLILPENRPHHARVRWRSRHQVGIEFI